MAKTNSNGRLVYIEASQMPQTGVFFSDGVSNDNVSHRPEDLSMSVDLQVIVPKITDKMKAKEGFFDVTYSNGTPKYISFLQGSKIGKKTNAGEGSKSMAVKAAKKKQMQKESLKTFMA